VYPLEDFFSIKLSWDVHYSALRRLKVTFFLFSFGSSITDFVGVISGSPPSASQLAFFKKPNNRTIYAMEYKNTNSS